MTVERQLLEAESGSDKCHFGHGADVRPRGRIRPGADIPPFTVQTLAELARILGLRRSGESFGTAQ